MPVRFTYDAEYGLRIEADEGTELTEQQATIVAVRDLASGMESLANAMWELYDEFRFKDFYDPDAARPAPPKKPPAKKRAAKRSVKKRTRR